MEVSEDFVDKLKGFIDIKTHPGRYKKAANMFHDWFLVFGGPNKK